MIYSTGFLEVVADTIQQTLAYSNLYNASSTKGWVVKTPKPIRFEGCAIQPNIEIVAQAKDYLVVGIGELSLYFIDAEIPYLIVCKGTIVKGLAKHYSKIMTSNFRSYKNAFALDGIKSVLVLNTAFVTNKSAVDGNAMWDTLWKLGNKKDLAVLMSKIAV